MSSSSPGATKAGPVRYCGSFPPSSESWCRASTSLSDIPSRGWVIPVGSSRKNWRFTSPMSPMSIRHRQSRPGLALRCSATGARSASPVGRAKSSTGEKMSKPRLQDHYETTLRPALMQEFGYTNPMQVPRLDKIVVNMGVGEAVQDSKKVEAAASELTAITGQHPVITRAKRSIATFKLREGMPIGCKVTLRRQRMYEFLDRLINVALPRVRDFRGISGKSFDGRGNFALGLKEQIVFPEIDYDRVDAVRGMNVVVTTTARTDAEAKALLKGFDMPFAN